MPFPCISLVWIDQPEKKKPMFSSFRSLCAPTDCQKVLTLYGMSNLVSEDEHSLDIMDPYQRDAKIIGELTLFKLEKSKQLTNVFIPFLQFGRRSCAVNSNCPSNPLRPRSNTTNRPSTTKFTRRPTKFASVRRPTSFRSYPERRTSWNRRHSLLHFKLKQWANPSKNHLEQSSCVWDVQRPHQTTRIPSLAYPITRQSYSRD